MTDMSGQPPPPPPPHKDNDNLSPPFRATAGRQTPTTPSSSAQRDSQEQRGLIRYLLQRQNEQSLELIAYQPGLPQRSAFPSHEEWLQALITAALRQSDRTQRQFGHGESERGEADEGDTDRHSPRDDAM